MAQRAHAQDAYGRPLPEVTDAYRAVLKARPVNVLQRRRISAMLEDLYDALLRRDIRAEVAVSFTVVGGMIQPDIDASIRRQYHFAPEA